MHQSGINVLFVSLRNNSRSTLAQACLEHLGKERFRAFSCGAPGRTGSAPDTAASRALIKAAIPLSQTDCRDWTAFTQGRIIKMHFVINLAQELADSLPAWPGQPITATWPFADVVGSDGVPELVDQATWTTLLALRRRIELLTSLPMQGAEKSAIRDDIRDMAHMR